MLSIGSIVYLKEGSQKLMILNRGPIVMMDEQKTMFDYSACRYPLGFVEDQVFYFNEENIDQIIFEGYKDSDESRFQTLYQEMLGRVDDDVVKGEVGGPMFLE